MSGAMDGPIVLGTLGPIDEAGPLNPSDSEEVRRLKRINLALLRRVEQVIDSQAGAYSLFQTAIQRELLVQKRTAELSQALKRLEQTNRENLAARVEFLAIVPAAISNAIFDATGVRLRSVPFTPAKVKAALQAT